MKALSDGHNNRILNKTVVSIGNKNKSENIFKISDTMTSENENDIENKNVNGKTERMKSLNVIFMYNGHSWDAYEVLGIAPGSSLNEIKKSFENALQKSDPKSHDFFKLALTAILEEIKKDQDSSN